MSLNVLELQPGLVRLDQFTRPRRILPSNAKSHACLFPVWLRTFQGPLSYCPLFFLCVQADSVISVKAGKLPGPSRSSASSTVAFPNSAPCFCLPRTLPLFLIVTLRAVFVQLSSFVQVPLSPQPIVLYLVSGASLLSLSASFLFSRRLAGIGLSRFQDARSLASARHCRVCSRPE
ncbi:hypothetical protein GQ43DRAFT_230212 [Delitschia confertaspora ATCC 74209]|uniref:Uncharacterized protein n=1 Tax=Delitschia confertaspora ATCC 74209 TaxID=1513339 RepID=A0A9P4JGU1_9PLEO|nr:hypothetical protein GQ43DRAFT_230212 [Delitschia confertaspora ATCC 74209]